jgi:Co/Zn/Cd efflux system component
MFHRFWYPPEAVKPLLLVAAVLGLLNAPLVCFFLLNYTPKSG